MKDALREYGRTVAIFAAAGLVLSLLVGLLARNPFGVMLLRALLFALFFGAVGAGMQYVVRRFLPGIAGGEATVDEGGDDAGMKPEGSTIDIVLPEEPIPAAEPSAGRDEPLEELPGTGEAAEAAAVEELEDGESPIGPARARAGLDTLPDIGSFGAGDDAARSSTRNAARSATRFPGARAKPSDVTRDVLEREDPATLARAVRTVLKREEHP